MLEINKVYQGDCLEIMKGIDDKSIDMILCDLPYGTTTCKWDIIIPFEPLWKQYKRLIKPNSAIVLFGSQPFTTILISSNIAMFKYCNVWVKTKPSGYQIAKIKPLSAYEDICIFGIGRITYNPQMTLRDKPRIGRVHRTNNQMKVSGGGIYIAEKEYTHKYPTTVLNFANGSQKDKIHPTQKPIDLCEYLIKTYSNEGDLVLDSCAGSGTTGKACKNLDRNFILIEKEEKYYKLIEEWFKGESIGYKNKSKPTKTETSIPNRITKWRTA